MSYFQLEDAVHTAILTLKEGFEGQMTEDNVEIGICNEKGFRRLTPQEVKDLPIKIDSDRSKLPDLQSSARKELVQNSNLDSW